MRRQIIALNSPMNIAITLKTMFGLRNFGILSFSYSIISSICATANMEIGKIENANMPISMDGISLINVSILRFTKKTHKRD